MQQQTRKFQHVKFTGGDFKLVSDQTQQLQNNQILIKVLYSSVNYYDKMLLKNKQNENCCLGSEGCGTIEQVGSELDENIVGKKVAFMCDGWGEYAVKNLNDCIILEDNTELKNAVDAFINPLSALCLRRIILQQEQRNVIIDGASCHLGRTLIELCRDSDIQICGIVRDDKAAQELKEKYNLKWVLNQNQQDFDSRFKELCKNQEFCPNIYISCVGGDLTGRVFKMMPPKSQLIIVGNLSEKDLTLPVTQLFLEGKQIRGFFLERYLKEELTQAQFSQLCDVVREDFKNGGKVFGVSATKEMDLKEWDKALNELDNIHGGKILLNICAQ
ncbi:zinc-binding dehydrogenase family protein [Stylonychia lemnae]|uniref:Zinc-binding dehydrogenase family protein n=1 Tax=Stylonychia lemnae TaxID=5949 RepID=A0A078ARD0_STYLE|nr:zinc-binding dehydrogenase family protein [Stylonychia lemnae]|eukprot:CDW83403.1 zinc-binding dehydrogenase family protein [Stylonychia lemnae]